MFIQDQLVWCRLQHQAEPSLVLFLLCIPKILLEIHQHDLDHHGGLLQAREQDLQDYCWLGMEAALNTSANAASVGLPGP
jgi:hypothetical protein